MSHSNKETAGAREPLPPDTPEDPHKFLIIGVPIALMALSCATIVAGLGLGYWTTLGPGPGFFPVWIGVLLGVSSAVWLIQALRGNPNVATPPADPPTDTDVPADSIATAPPAKKRPIWIVLLSLIILASLLDILGFQLAMFAFLIFHLKFQGDRKWLSSLVIAAAGSFGVYYLFTDVLQVTLPSSSIGFLEKLGL